MQDFLEKIFRSFSEFFKGLDTVKKIGLIAIACFILSTMVGIIVWASKTRFEVLYSELNKEDSRKIAIMLEEKKIPYQTSEDGKTIKIT